jgi:ketosteroid isomerase-like protein
LKGLSGVNDDQEQKNASSVKPMDAVDAVRGLYEAYQERDWVRASLFLHPEAVVEMPATAERLEGSEAVIAFQRAYPEPWGVMTVKRVVADGEGAAAEIGVVDPEGRAFALASFWCRRQGLLDRGVEYWVDIAGALPPASRASSPVTEAARRAWTVNEINREAT